MQANLNFLAMFSSPVAGKGVSGLQSELMPMDQAKIEGFTNILDLVDDMEIADANNPSAQDAVEEALLKVEDEGLRALNLARSEAGLGQFAAELRESGSKNPVGQKPSPEGLAFETASTNEMLLELSPAPTASKETSSTKVPDGEALKQWAFALSRGEVKSVEVESTQRVLQELHRQDPSLKSSLESAWLLAKAKGEGAAKEDSSLATRVEPKASALSEIANKPESLGKGESSFKPELASLTADKTEPQRVVSAEKDVDVEGEESKSLSGRDFLLSQQSSAKKQKPSADPLKGGSMVMAGAVPQEVISDKGALLSSDDGRVDQQTLSFVADKVERLAEQGGGRLRVHLNPEGMGEIELRVSKRGGELHVELRAENQMTLKGLEEGRVELSERLAKVAPSKLDLVLSGAEGSGRTSLVSSSAFSRETTSAQKVEVGHDFSSPMNRQAQDLQVESRRTEASADFLRMRLGELKSAEMNSAVGLRSAEEGARSGMRKEVFENTSSFDSTADSQNGRRQEGQGFSHHAADRDERRSQAMEQWEKQFSEKRKAS